MHCVVCGSRLNLVVNHLRAVCIALAPCNFVLHRYPIGRIVWVCDFFVSGIFPPRMSSPLLALLGHTDLARPLLARWVDDDADLTSLPCLLMTSRSVCKVLHTALHQWLRDVFDTARVPQTTMTRFALQFYLYARGPADYHAFVTQRHQWLKGDTALDELVTLASFLAMVRAMARLLHAARWEGAAIKYNSKSMVRTGVTSDTLLRDVFYLDARTYTMQPLRDLPDLTECVIEIRFEERMALATDAENSLKAFLFNKALDTVHNPLTQLALWYYYAKKETAVHAPPRDATLIQHVFVEKVPLYSPCNKVVSTLRNLLYVHSDDALNATEKQQAMTLALRMTELPRHFLEALSVPHWSIELDDPPVVTLGVDRQAVPLRAHGKMPTLIYDSEYSDSDNNDTESSASDDWQPMATAQEVRRRRPSESSSDDSMPPLG